jgi:hypothetical protein
MIMTLFVEDDIDVLKKDERVVLDLHLQKKVKMLTVGEG